jgi:hypothetical protein
VAQGLGDLFVFGSSFLGCELVRGGGEEAFEGPALHATRRKKPVDRDVHDVDPGPGELALRELETVLDRHDAVELGAFVDPVGHGVEELRGVGEPALQVPLAPWGVGHVPIVVQEMI